MTTQIVMSTRSSTLSLSSSQPIQPGTVSKAAVVSTPNCKMESMKYHYQADQQVKFLHLQAEIDSLLIELQTVTKQRGTDRVSPVHQVQ